MITFINDCHNDDSLAMEIRGQLIDNLHQSYEIKEYNGNNSDLAYCTGCFECWGKTPGICNIVDKSFNISRSMLLSEIVIVLSKITYGGYSSFVKKIFDRNVINRLPFYSEYKGRVVLKDRYDKYPLIITIGYSNNLLLEEEELFLKYTCNEVGNTKTPLSVNFVVKEACDIKDIINKIKGSI